MKFTSYDYVIIGAGMYGMYFATQLATKHPSKKICILEYDDKPFQRASFTNQARVHNGYHYPRSLSTALKSSNYYNRFVNDYSFAINKSFDKIYAISQDFSFASVENFKNFCKSAKIQCDQINHDKYFTKGLIEAAFLTDEYSFDAKKISDFFLSKIQHSKIDIIYNSRILSVEKNKDSFILFFNKEKISTEFVFNSTYASINQVLDLFNFEMFKIKYELAEVALCNVTSNIKNVGITVMDGPFFSLMPFGQTGLHSLSAVHYTPHKTCENFLPNFNCQLNNSECTDKSLGNCNSCVAKPKTAWNHMNQLALKYLKDDIEMEYNKSLFGIKPILKTTEISDSRPTIIKEFSKNPTFISVLSGKFNTMYDLDIIIDQY